MNKYQRLIKLLTDNNLTIHAKECYDGASGWHGEELWIVDKSNSKAIFDLSVNGYCFRDESVGEAIDAVEAYLESKKMQTFDDFKAWVHKNKEKG